MSEIALFEQKEIRRVWQNEEWYFSVLDVVKALTDSTDPKQYIKKMRARDPELSNNWGTICTPVQMIAADGKQRKVQAANSEGLLRIIQSIPSPKAEPFKRWLAAIGAERIREIADPEIAALRAQELYRKKGYPDDWIALRARGGAAKLPVTPAKISSGRPGAAYPRAITISICPLARVRNCRKRNPENSCPLANAQKKALKTPAVLGLMFSSRRLAMAENLRYNKVG